MVYFAWRCAQRFRLGSISRTLPFPVPKRKGASFPASPPNPAETGSPSRFCMRRGGQEHGCKGFPKTRVALPPHSMKDVWMNGWMGGCAASCLMFCMKLLTSLGRMDPIWADCRAWVGSVSLHPCVHNVPFRSVRNNGRAVVSFPLLQPRLVGEWACCTIANTLRCRGGK